MGAMTVDEIYKDRKKFSQKVFDIASTDLFNMGIQVKAGGNKLFSLFFPPLYPILWQLPQDTTNIH